MGGHPVFRGIASTLDPLYQHWVAILCSGGSLPPWIHCTSIGWPSRVQRDRFHPGSTVPALGSHPVFRGIASTLDPLYQHWVAIPCWGIASTLDPLYQHWVAILCSGGSLPPWIHCTSIGWPSRVQGDRFHPGSTVPALGGHPVFRGIASTLDPLYQHWVVIPCSGGSLPPWIHCTSIGWPSRVQGDRFHPGSTVPALGGHSVIRGIASTLDPLYQHWVAILCSGGSLPPWIHCTSIGWPSRVGGSLPPWIHCTALGGHPVFRGIASTLDPLYQHWVAILCSGGSLPPWIHCTSIGWPSCVQGDRFHPGSTVPALGGHPVFRGIASTLDPLYQHRVAIPCWGIASTLDPLYQHWVAIPCSGGSLPPWIHCTSIGWPSRVQRDRFHPGSTVPALGGYPVLGDRFHPGSTVPALGGHPVLGDRFHPGSTVPALGGHPVFRGIASTLDPLYQHWVVIPCSGGSLPPWIHCTSIGWPSRVQGDRFLPGSTVPALGGHPVFRGIASTLDPLYQHWVAIPCSGGSLPPWIHCTSIGWPSCVQGDRFHPGSTVPALGGHPVFREIASSLDPLYQHCVAIPCSGGSLPPWIHCTSIGWPSRVQGDRFHPGSTVPALGGHPVFRGIASSLDPLYQHWVAILCSGGSLPPWIHCTSIGWPSRVQGDRFLPGSTVPALCGHPVFRGIASTLDPLYQHCVAIPCSGGSLPPWIHCTSIGWSSRVQGDRFLPGSTVPALGGHPVFRGIASSLDPLYQHWVAILCSGGSLTPWIHCTSIGWPSRVQRDRFHPGSTVPALGGHPVFRGIASTLDPLYQHWVAIPCSEGSLPPWIHCTSIGWPSRVQRDRFHPGSTVPALGGHPVFRGIASTLDPLYQHWVAIPCSGGSLPPWIHCTSIGWPSRVQGDRFHPGSTVPALGGHPVFRGIASTLDPLYQHWVVIPCSGGSLPPWIHCTSTGWPSRVQGDRFLPGSTVPALGGHPVFRGIASTLDPLYQHWVAIPCSGGSLPPWIHCTSIGWPSCVQGDRFHPGSTVPALGGHPVFRGIASSLDPLYQHCVAIPCSGGSLPPWIHCTSIGWPSRVQGDRFLPGSTVPALGGHPVFRGSLPPWIHCTSIGWPSRVQGDRFLPGSTVPALGGHPVFRGIAYTLDPLYQHWVAIPCSEGSLPPWIHCTSIGWPSRVQRDRFHPGSTVPALGGHPVFRGIASTLDPLYQHWVAIPCSGGSLPPWIHCTSIGWSSRVQGDRFLPGSTVPALGGHPVFRGIASTLDPLYQHWVAIPCSGGLLPPWIHCTSIG